MKPHLFFFGIGIPHIQLNTLSTSYFLSTKVLASNLSDLSAMVCRTIPNKHTHGALSGEALSIGTTRCCLSSLQFYPLKLCCLKQNQFKLLWLLSLSESEPLPGALTQLHSDLFQALVNNSVLFILHYTQHSCIFQLVVQTLACLCCP